MICDICHKKDGGTDATTILNLVKMDKDMYLIHQAPNKLLSSYLSNLKGGSTWSNHPKDPYGPTPPQQKSSLKTSS